MTLLKLLARRWYVSVPMLIAAVAVAVVVEREAPREYEAIGYALLEAPELDPSTSPIRVIDLAGEISRLQSEQGRASLSAIADVDDVDVRLMDVRTVEVRVPGTSDADILTVETVLADLEGHVRASQEQAGVPPMERLQPTTDIVRVEMGVEEVEGAEPEASTVGRLVLDDPTIGIVNPFGPHDATVRVIEVAVESDAGQAEVFERAGNDELLEFDVSPERGPGIMQIWVSATTPASALDGFEVVRHVVSEELERRQERADVPTTHRLKVQTLAAPLEVTDLTGPVSRAAAVAFALGASLMIAAVIGVEKVARRRHTPEPRNGHRVNGKPTREARSLEVTAASTRRSGDGA